MGVCVIVTTGSQYAFQVSLYPFCWAFKLYQVSDPVEESRLDLGPLYIRVTRIIGT